MTEPSCEAQSGTCAKVQSDACEQVLADIMNAASR
jgi:hypothetical protein